MILTFSLSIGYAQPGGGSGIGGGQGGPQPPVGAPIDGGAGLLLAAVAGYAYKKIKPQGVTR